MDIRKYDIVLANLSGTVGNEQGGKRPVVVIQNNIGNIHSCTTIVFPLSKQLKNLDQPTHTLIKKSINTGLREDSLVLGEQIRVISSQRIICKLGSVTDKEERKELKRVYDASFGEE